MTPNLFSQPLDTTVQKVPVSLIMPPPEGTPVMPGIATQGVMQSVLLKPTGDSQIPYQIVDGDRRMASAIAYGLKEVPALITDGTRGQIAAMSAILNASRGPNILDEARSWQTALEEGHFHSVKELAENVHVSEKTIKARLRLMELPESLLEHVGISIAPGVAMQLAKLDGSYRTQAIMAAEAKLDCGEKFTGADLKAATTRRLDDRSQIMEGLFEQFEQPILLVTDPVRDLALEVQRLANIQGVRLNELIASLHTLTEESSTVLTQAPAEVGAQMTMPSPSLDLAGLLGGGEEVPLIESGDGEGLDLAGLLGGGEEVPLIESGDGEGLDLAGLLGGGEEVPLIESGDGEGLDLAGLLGGGEEVPLIESGDGEGLDLAGLLGGGEAEESRPQPAAVPAPLAAPTRFRPGQRYT
ncbi:ParB/RepB/Spo0J family partition protein [Deinococcus proteolyticus]|nr:ParB/RepB/Spo0J family partition protein [Deinococcus proteolyticus]